MANILKELLLSSTVLKAKKAWTNMHQVLKVKESCCPTKVSLNLGTEEKDGGELQLVLRELKSNAERPGRERKE